MQNSAVDAGSGRAQRSITESAFRLPTHAARRACFSLTLPRSMALASPAYSACWSTYSASEDCLSADAVSRYRRSTAGAGSEVLPPGAAERSATTRKEEFSRRTRAACLASAAACSSTASRAAPSSEPYSPSASSLQVRGRVCVGGVACVCVCVLLLLLLVGVDNELPLAWAPTI